MRRNVRIFERRGSEDPLVDLIDLHAHTTASDGTLTPVELVNLAKESGLVALGISDHDTFAGYEEAVEPAEKIGLPLVRGIELNGKIESNNGLGRSVHILGYFPSREPSQSFRDWLKSQYDERKDRNKRLAKSLQAKGLDITVAEVEARGRNMAGRTHFARILVEKGYVSSYHEAFRKFLGESAPTFVDRQSLSASQVLSLIRDAGGLPVVAHPVRLSLPRDVEYETLLRWKSAGLAGLEVYHSEHDAGLQAHYSQLAKDLDLLPTGGSDFHGGAKPDVALGSGRNGNVQVPAEILRNLRNFRVQAN